MFFFVIYRLTYAVSVLGYVFLVGEFMGFSQVIGAIVGDQAFHLGSYAITLLFYGLYFGVLNRDCAEIVTERMASTMGVRPRRKMSNTVPMTRSRTYICVATCSLLVKEKIRICQ
jgi:RING finger protein 121/175